LETFGVLTHLQGQSSLYRPSSYFTWEETEMTGREGYTEKYIRWFEFRSKVNFFRQKRVH